MSGVLLEGGVGRRLRRTGLWLLLLASVLPYHGCRAHPVEFDRPGSRDGDYGRDRPAYVPAVAVEWCVRWLLEDDDPDEREFLFGPAMNPDDNGGAVFVLLPFWVAALLLARRERERRTLGLAMWAVSLGMLVAAAFWSFKHFRTIGPSGLRNPERLAVILGFAFVLLWRPPGRRRPADVEATVSSQAFAGLQAAAFFPAAKYFEWILDDGHSQGAALLALWHNYRAGFWVALAGLAMVAAPLYFSGERLARLYDAPIPWPSRWWTRTRTSTSTGSTPTGTPSSTAPAPPGSSRS